MRTTGTVSSDFPEMFCLAAAEIERYGKPLIVSNYKALSERVVNNGASGTALFTSNHIWRRAFKPLFGIEE